jgi:hypothetical protein
MRYLLLLLALPLFAQEEAAPVHHSALYTSAAFMIASQAADAATTIYVTRQPGGREGNPLGVYGVLIGKAISTPLLLRAEYRQRNHPKAAKWFTAINWGLSVEFGGLAAHNAMLKH